MDIGWSYPGCVPSGPCSSFVIDTPKELPDLPQAKFPLEAARNSYEHPQTHDGHWPGENRRPRPGLESSVPNDGRLATIRSLTATDRAKKMRTVARNLRTMKLRRGFIDSSPHCFLLKPTFHPSPITITSYLGSTRLANRTPLHLFPTARRLGHEHQIPPYTHPGGGYYSLMYTPRWESAPVIDYRLVREGRGRYSPSESRPSELNVHQVLPWSQALR